MSRRLMAMVAMTGMMLLAGAAVLLLPLLLVGKAGSPPSRLQIFLVLTLSLATLLTRTLTVIGALTILIFVWLAQQRSRKLWMWAAAVGAGAAGVHRPAAVLVRHDLALAVADFHVVRPRPPRACRRGWSRSDRSSPSCGS